MARHLITSALPYVNGTKHLGNLLGSLLPADIAARHRRRQGDEVVFVCGTDEHGAATELAADNANTTPAALSAQFHGIQRDLFRRFHLSFDHFGRTSSPENHATTIALYERLKASGLIERRVLHQLYSPREARFLADRYVLGECPHCGHPDARGDQCEACNALLDPTDLISPRSVNGSTDLEVRASEHAFLRLSALQPEVARWVDTRTDWPALSRQVAQSWLRQGLQDRCITRDLSWGIPVPDLPGKVFYCWFDAPIGYLSLAQIWADQNNTPTWWTDDVTIHQFLGKDNLPFHTVFFPGILLGSGFRGPDRVVGYHWLTWYGDKFSTRDHRGVFLNDALELLPADVWRWGLLAQIPERSDSRFTWDLLARTVNKDLVGGYGNFLQRVLRLTAQLGDTIPSAGAPTATERRVSAHCAEILSAAQAAYDGHRFREVVDHIRALLRLSNLYIEERAPWTLRRTDPVQAAVVLRTCVQLIHVYVSAAAPILPQTTQHVAEIFNVPESVFLRPLETLVPLRGWGGQPFENAPALFERLDADALADLFSA